MRKHKKIIIIAAIAVVVLGATLGAVTIAQADTNAAAASANVTPAPKVNLYDKVASILNQTKGTNITGADLQAAFQQAQKQTADEALNNFLNKLVADGKITQQQATDYKNWLNSKPTQTFSDQYQNWMNSRPNIPGLPGFPGKAGFGQRLPRMGGMMFGR